MRRPAPRVIDRPTLTTLGALAILVALAWVYLVASPMPMPATAGGLYSGRYAALTLVMWFVMMIGMMTPSVTPATLLFARVNRHGNPSAAAGRTACFVTGYLAIWLAFSVLATVLQIAWIATGWIDAMGVSARSTGTAAVLIAVGLYQWTPAKRACLAQCQSPAEFIVRAHRPGLRGGFVMGLHHGLYCLGCCWALMLLLFVGGVMNLAWVAVIAAIVIVEKLVPRAPWLPRLVGVGCFAAAVTVVLR
ncbi:MAG: hypothetical protein NAOJABEB_02924 [Steroidobacteraceae bacterium]|nr:hypothetical protein [Steroidobacteraceae bacterium]